MTANRLRLCPLPTPRTFLMDRSVVVIAMFSGCHALPTAPDPWWHLWVKPAYPIPSMSPLPLVSISQSAKQVLKPDGWLSVLYHPCAPGIWELPQSKHSVWAIWHLLAPVWKGLKFCSTSTADTKSGVREALFKILRLTQKMSHQFLLSLRKKEARWV